MMALPRLTLAEHYDAALRARIDSYTADAASVMTADAEAGARLKELRDPATVTEDNADARLKALAKLQPERLAVAARARALATEALDILEGCRRADEAERTRLATAANARRVELREQLAVCNIVQEPDVRRCLAQDAELRNLCASGSQIGTAHLKRVSAAKDALARTTAEVAAMLA